MFFFMRWYTKKAPSQRDIRASKKFAAPDPVMLKRIFVLGLPIGLALFLKLRCLL